MIYVSISEIYIHIIKRSFYLSTQIPGLNSKCIGPAFCYIILNLILIYKWTVTNSKEQIVILSIVKLINILISSPNKKMWKKQFGKYPKYPNSYEQTELGTSEQDGIRNNNVIITKVMSTLV